MGKKTVGDELACGMHVFGFAYDDAVVDPCHDEYLFRPVDIQAWIGIGRFETVRTKIVIVRLIPCTAGTF